MGGRLSRAGAGAPDFDETRPRSNLQRVRVSKNMEGDGLLMETPMRAIGIRDWDELEERMFRSEWIGGALILLFLLLVVVGLLQGA